MSRLLSGGQRIGASASVLPMNTQSLCPWRLAGLILLLSKGLSVVFSSSTFLSNQFLGAKPFCCPALTSIHDYLKNYRLDYIDHCRQSNVSVFNLLSLFLTAFLSRNRSILNLWLQLPPTVILDSKKRKSATVSTGYPSISHEVMGPDAMIFIVWMSSFKPGFSLSSFTFIKSLFSYSSFSVIKVVSFAYLRWLIFIPSILIPACASSGPVFAWCSLHRS